MLNRTPNSIGILLLWIFLFSFILAAETVNLGEIKRSLICGCECGMTVEACEGSMACESAGKLTSEAKTFIQNGLNSEQVLASFVSLYGEQVLAEPSKKGFNLVAWILPFVITILAGIGIVIAVGRWVKKAQNNFPLPDPAKHQSDDPKYEQQLDDILKRMDE